MAQEFTIKSQDIEDKINQLLPSQGGFQPGVDFSASTMVVPIVDLTETAEGSSLRQDLQRALSFGSATEFDVRNTTSTIITTTGYWQLSGSVSTALVSGLQVINIIINDGTTDKTVWGHRVPASSGSTALSIDNLIIKLNAGDKLKIACTSDAICKGSVRQIADISENLINP
jgi:hypothetical protein